MSKSKLSRLYMHMYIYIYMYRYTYMHIAPRCTIAP